MTLEEAKEILKLKMPLTPEQIILYKEALQVASASPFQLPEPS